MNSNLIDRLFVGAKIKVGEKYSEFMCGAFKPGEIITLIQGYFEYDNGLYSETQTAPAIWDEEQNDFHSIFHLFGNNLEDFMDCSIELQEVKECDASKAEQRFDADNQKKQS